LHPVGHVEEQRRGIAAVALHVAAEFALIGVPHDVAGFDHSLAEVAAGAEQLWASQLRT